MLRGEQKVGRQPGWPGGREASRDPAGRCNSWQPVAQLHILPPSPQTHMVLVARWHTLWWLAGCPSAVPSIGGPPQLPPPPPASDCAGGARPLALVRAALPPPPADAGEGRTRKLAAGVRPCLLLSCWELRLPLSQAAACLHAATLQCCRGGC